LPVAVAVVRSPRASGLPVWKEKETRPWRLVVTIFWPRNVSPSSTLEGSL
jgi:hypothetical protein